MAHTRPATTKGTSSTILLMRKSAHFVTALFAIACILLVPGQPLASARFKVDTLGARVHPLDINDSGRVCGLAPVSKLPQGCSGFTPFTWKDGVYLGPTCDSINTGSEYTAYSINASGKAVGNDKLSNFSTNQSVAFLADQIIFGGGVNKIGFTSHTAFWAINNAGVVVGQNFVRVGSSSPLWATIFDVTSGTLTDSLEPFSGLLGESSALGINNSGQIIGVSSLGESGGGATVHAFLWTGGSSVIEIGVAGENTRPIAINDNGQVILGVSSVGPGMGSGRDGAYIWNAGQFTKLEDLPGGGAFGPLDINNLGQIVGVTLNSAGKFRGVLWLPDPAYGLLAGYHELGDLIPEAFNWEIVEATAINDSGQIVGRAKEKPESVVTRFGFVLTPRLAGFVVNSEGDAGDLDPNDGRCYTGSINSEGNEECTFRAAIEQANFSQFKTDTITFDIPTGTLIPKISLQSALPIISDNVEIDGSTQRNTARVELDGSAAGANVDGIVFQFASESPSGAPSDVTSLSNLRSSVHDLIINNFQGNGLRIRFGDRIHIENCLIGVAPDSVTARPNGAHGVLIDNGRNNLIGNEDFSRGNIIANNAGAGVFLAGGARNNIFGNRIYNNGGLGIDLAPEGVTLNDPGDLDTGPNSLTNYPILDSLKIGDTTFTVWGSIVGDGDEGFEPYRIEFFVSAECDTLGYGEGEFPVGFDSVFTDFAGLGSFASTFPLPQISRWDISATATFPGGTSEFAMCFGLTQNGFVVNSSGDEPDVFPGDGECSTGDTTLTGENECTLRAAIMEANATEGPDKIEFDIPESGVPIINLLVPLPAITDTVIINGLTQGLVRLVEINGINVVTQDGARVDGLTLFAGACEISGLSIHSFSGSGILISGGGDNSIHSNKIGTEASATLKLPNLLHGINVAEFSSGNIIGVNSAFPDRKGNVIAFNMLSGVFIDSGSHRNTMSRNSIFGNGGLGIDIYPPGVNLVEFNNLFNAANDRVQLPLIELESLFRTDTTKIRVTFFNGLEIAEIEVFVNDTCDISSYGEGKRFLADATIKAFQGEIYIITTTEQFDSTQSFTATGTDRKGNTSEFSECIEFKTIFVVNSAGDAPDASPGDGKCNTDGALVNGAPECTMRAALMEANAIRTPDAIIRFNIPGTGIPVIRPESALPDVRDTILIDGFSQPVTGLVELDGSNAGGGVDGLTLSSYHTEIRGLAIHSFSRSGIQINGGRDHAIYGNKIGTDHSGTLKRPNFLHGIHISELSRDNTIGADFSDGIPREGNVIAYNLSAGIFIDSGSVGNRMSENSIFENGAQGIDLYPAGVNHSDSLLSRNGANKRIPAPIITKVTLPKFPGSTWEVSGIFLGAHINPISVELFINDKCDNSGSGEGRRFITKTTTGFDVGVFSFLITAAIDSTQFLTVTATDIIENNTSEFSFCWPRKVLTLLDGDGDPLANKQFILSHVSNDIPTFSDTLIDTFITDISGKLDLSKYFWGFNGDTLAIGDSIKLHQVLHTSLAAKHQSLIGSAYRVVLDNAQFDRSGVMSYTELDTKGEQDIMMNHTTLEFNLVVSLEWDADLVYIQSLEQGFREMSNYLYDVSDGQVRLDTVMIFDSKANWSEADILIYASNSVWPHVNEISGILRPAGRASDPIEMPRKWFGTDTLTRNGTFNEHPLDMTAPSSYRTFAHEFGHYALSLFDEYVFPDGGVRCGDRPELTKPYGYMDCHYPNCGAYSSELSNKLAYANAACQNNEHWDVFRQSTWETFELLFQKKYDGILAPIIRPSERSLLFGLDYMPGPNDLAGAVDYDVGSLVEFPMTHGATLARSLKIRFFLEADPSSELRPNMSVLLLDTSQVANTIDLQQGNTSDDGGIWVVGKLPVHELFAAGYSQILAFSGIRRSAGGRSWFYNGTSEEFADSAVIGLRQVQGDRSVISRVQLGASGLTYRLDAPNPFQSAPTVQHQPDGGARTNHTFLDVAGGYSVTIADSLSSFGKFRLSAVDDSGAAYTFSADYTTRTPNPGAVSNIKGPRGVSEAKLDNTGSTIESALLLSTDYPVLRTGLSPAALQGGPAQNLAIFPEQALSGNNSITIRYSDADLLGASGSLDEEKSLRIFHWNTAGKQWDLVDGVVDTFYNEVTASISETGVYASFTTSLSCCSTAGDANTDGRVNIADVQFVIAWLFAGGASPNCCSEGSANGDDKINIADVTYIITWLFMGGADPICGPAEMGC